MALLKVGQLAAYFPSDFSDNFLSLKADKRPSLASILRPDSMEDNMAVEYLKEVASAPLPRVAYRKKEIDSIRLLRAAGLVIAQIPEDVGPGEVPYAKVVAVTEEGHREMLDIR